MPLVSEIVQMFFFFECVNVQRHIFDNSVLRAHYRETVTL